MKKIWMRVERSWKSTPAERLIHGSSTVTEFVCVYEEQRDSRHPAVVVVRGYGKTLADRKSDALAKAKPKLEEANYGRVT
jgi:hypothetical protein